MIYIGVAGNPDSFYEAGYKRSAQMPQYLEESGLNAYEYQCGKGVRVSAPLAEILKKNAERHRVVLSLHAPYYISLASPDEEKRENSIRYILQSASAAKAMGANRIVVHPGSCGKMDRQSALTLAKETLQKAVQKLDENELGEVHICPETMGKINQLGTVEEIAELCTLDDRLIPCIDFGHINARSHGGLNTVQDFEKVFDLLQNRIGEDRLKHYHAHFSKIEYSQGGEVRHLTFEDTQFGPLFEPVAEVTLRRGMSPTIICESAGTQAIDAMYMSRVFTSLEG